MRQTSFSLSKLSNSVETKHITLRPKNLSVMCFFCAILYLMEFLLQCHLSRTLHCFHQKEHKSYEEIDVFLKQFPHLNDIVLEGLKTKSSKNLFRKLNEHSKELQAKQEEIIEKNNSLLKQYDELEHLKNNMNEYLGRTKTDKKESVIGEIKRFKAEEKAKPTEKKEASKEAER